MIFTSTGFGSAYVRLQIWTTNCSHRQQIHCTTNVNKLLRWWTSGDVLRSVVLLLLLPALDLTVFFWKLTRLSCLLLFSSGDPAWIIQDLQTAWCIWNIWRLAMSTITGTVLFKFLHPDPPSTSFSRSPPPLLQIWRPVWDVEISADRVGWLAFL